MNVLRYAPKSFAHRTACICLAAVSSLSSLAVCANAQEDGPEDHGSRAMRRAGSDDSETDESGQVTERELPSGEAQPTQPGPAAEPKVKPRKSKQHKSKKKKRKKKHGKRRAKRKARSPWQLGYELGAFAGTHVQDGSFGPLVNAAVAGRFDADADRVSLDLFYGYDPYSTKTFNFPEEESAASESRLTRPMHELGTILRQRHEWNSWFQTELRARADWWIPDLDLDERRSLRLEPELRFGGREGVYVSLGADGFYKQFPNYLVADRRLDQRGVDSTIEAGYTFSLYNRVGLGLELDYTEYIDARYDTLAADGTIQRATNSKVYFERSPYVFGSIRPVKQFRANARYSYELNDSIDYDRRMTGRIDGELVAKFIPDYYDYRRHRISLNTTTRPDKRWDLGTLSEIWFRNFDTYEARNVDNDWLGEKRKDFSLELGLEISYRIWQFEAWGLDHGLYLSGFGSHLHRRSNMKREVSLATNFEVTRAFVGLELRDF